MESTEQTVAAATPATVAGAASVGPKPYELSQRTLFSPHELRRLTADYDTIRRSCGVRLAVLFRSEFDFKLDSLETPTFRQFVGNLAQPTHLALFKVEPLRGVGVLEIAPALALCLLDRLMGGPGAAGAPARELTEIEVALLGQISQLLTEAWCAHWAGWKELKPALIGHESDPRYLQTSAPESTLLVANFTAQIGDCSGAVRLALPFTTLEPLLQKIRAELKPPVETPTPAMAVPKATTWNPALDHVNIPINAELPGPQITARMLQTLKVGDVLSLPVEAANQVQLRLGGVTRFNARLGTRDEHWAVEVLNALKS
ncbi:MAG: flagellar motor switch protein FliM [Verrucomicrobiota bacterium]